MTAAFAAVDSRASIQFLIFYVEPSLKCFFVYLKMSLCIS